MKKILSTLLIFSSLGAQASYLESCLFIGKVEGFTKVLKLNDSVSEGRPITAVVKVLRSEDQGSHHPEACEKKEGTRLVLELTSDDYQKLQAKKDEKKVVKLDYFYVSGKSLTGFSENTRIKLVE